MSLALVLILTINMTVVILLLNSEVYAVTANTTDFLIQVPSGWVYRENFRLYKELNNT